MRSRVGGGEIRLDVLLRLEFCLGFPCFFPLLFPCPRYIFPLAVFVLCVHIQVYKQRSLSGRGGSI